MSNYYFSAKMVGFYNDALKDLYDKNSSWPTDAVAITNDTYTAMISGQIAGKILSSDANGNPVLNDPPTPTASTTTAPASVTTNPAA
jgi:hypothetical protein